MSFPSSDDRNVSFARSWRWLLAFGLWLICGSEPILERPRCFLEGRLADLSHSEQLALGELPVRRLRETAAGRSRSRSGSPRESGEAVESALRQSARFALSRRRFDEAVAKLETLLRRNPDAADLESDLAAALLSRGQLQSNPYDFLLALKAADRALQLDPGFLPARFNRALALQRIRLARAAEEAWATYVQAERDPDWLQAARQARAFTAKAPESDDDLRELFEAAAGRGDQPAMAAAVARSPRFFREQAEEVLLVAWGEAVVRGDERAGSRALQQARWISEALALLHEDSTLARTLAQIERLGATAPQDLAILGQGLKDYGMGLALARTDDFQAALAPFDRAEKHLSKAGSPFVAWATLNIALCHYQRYDYVAANRLAQALVVAAQQDKAWSLHGQAVWLLGLIALIEGDSGAAQSHFETALKDFERLSEESYQARLQNLIASCLDYLGQRREAWRWLHSALVTEESFRQAGVGIATNLMGSSLALEDGAPEVALLFQEEALRAARAGGRSALIADALRGRADIFESLGQIEEARQDLEDSRGELRKIGDKKLARGIEGNLAFLEGQIAREASPAEALGHFDEAIEIFRSTSYWYRLVQALTERARLSIALGRPAPAERDLAEAIAESERQRLTIELPSYRISYFDQIRTLLDLAIDLELREFDRPQKALELSERAKARVLWDWLKLQPSPGELAPDLEASLAPDARFEDWRCELPQSGLVVEYAVLRERLVMWRLRDCVSAEATSAEIGAEALAALVRQFRDAVSDKRRKRADALAAELYDRLIRPVASSLGPGDPLVLIPDGPLHGLPFALLLDRETGRRLVEDHAISLAPSLRVLAASRLRDRALARGGAPRALIVTVPEAVEGSKLDKLESGEVEAAIAQVLPGSSVLAGAAATKEAFLSLSGDLEILHFGGHSIVNSNSPLLSYMLFAPTPEDPSGMLYSRDLLKQRFPTARLAVLASCETGIGKVSQTEGVESLARPFLATGVPGVIASLWPVDDRSTAEFFLHFYGRLAKSWNVAEALRETQIELLEQDPDGAAFLNSGGFVFIGTAFSDESPAAEHR